MYIPHVHTFTCVYMCLQHLHSHARVSGPKPHISTHYKLHTAYHINSLRNSLAHQHGPMYRSPRTHAAHTHL
jgi:hypothetical protein